MKNSAAKSDFLLFFIPKFQTEICLSDIFAVLQMLFILFFLNNVQMHNLPMFILTRKILPYIVELRLAFNS